MKTNPLLIRSEDIYKEYFVNFNHRRVIGKDKILKDYQSQSIDNWFDTYREGIKPFIKSYFSRCLKFDFGLGKTLTSCAIIDFYLTLLPELKIIIVCPASVKDEWRKELDGFDLRNDERIQLRSWDNIPTVKGSNKHFLLVLDEIQNACNYQTTRSKRSVALSKSKYCRATIQLTATPIPNGDPKALLPILTIMRHPFSFEPIHFLLNYCGGYYDTVWTGRGMQKVIKYTKNYQNQGFLADQIKDYFFQYLKEDVTDLEPIDRRMVPVKLNSDEQSIYIKKIRTLFKQFLAMADSTENASIGLLQKQRDFNSQVKVKKIKHRIASIAKRGIPQIVFVCSVKAGEYLTEYLRKKKVRCGLINGSTPETRRTELKNHFQLGCYDVLVLSLKACGTGLNLDKAHYVWMIDRDYSDAGTTQAENRAHRLTTKHKVYSIWVKLGVIDDKIDRFNLDKFKVANTIMGSSQTLDFTSMIEMSENDAKILPSIYCN